jgi:hypothetical protein
MCRQDFSDFHNGIEFSDGQLLSTGEQTSVVPIFVDGWPDTKRILLPSDHSNIEDRFYEGKAYVVRYGRIEYHDLLPPRNAHFWILILPTTDDQRPTTALNNFHSPICDA